MKPIKTEVPTSMLLNASHSLLWNFSLYFDAERKLMLRIGQTLPKSGPLPQNTGIHIVCGIHQRSLTLYVIGAAKKKPAAKKK